MVFPFTLKDFPRKYGVLHFRIFFSRMILFMYMVLFACMVLFINMILFIQHQQKLLESSVGAIESDHSST